MLRHRKEKQNRMSKIIKMTSQNLDEIRRDFEEALKGVNFQMVKSTLRRRSAISREKQISTSRNWRI